MSNGNYQETHERILESGLAAFLEEGFEKANLRRICKAVFSQVVLSRMCIGN